MDHQSHGWHVDFMEELHGIAVRKASHIVCDDLLPAPAVFPADEFLRQAEETEKAKAEKERPDRYMLSSEMNW